jgi:ABC-type bacteriocin/lantibiotic exporters, contain an N-terminal double-glycine peptidase domain
LIGYVPQKIFLTDDTLEKNIAFGVEEDEIKIEKLNYAINHSQLNEFISDRELGLKTKIGERGKQISAGQAQRIGIARALYKNPKILIFDEATSALDKKTEKRIIEDVLNLKNKGITVILVSHEPSVLAYCDKFYDLDENKYIKN